MKRMNKKGQQMTLGTIIAIVLGIAVLVFLIFGFVNGWGNMWDRVINFGGGSSNVDTIKQACAAACSGQRVYEFCDQERTLKFGEEISGISDGCDEIEETTKSKSCSASCYHLSDITSSSKIKSMGIEKCPGLC